MGISSYIFSLKRFQHFPRPPAKIRNLFAFQTPGHSRAHHSRDRQQQAAARDAAAPNDSSTIPVWLAEDEIAELESRCAIGLAAGGAPRSITGHIDFLLVQNDAVHILDFKPDARTNKPIAQLAIYALALTVHVPGLKHFDINCAWLNEEEYDEFFPRTLFATR